MRKLAVKAALAIVVAGCVGAGVGFTGANGVAEIETKGTAQFGVVDIVIASTNADESNRVIGTTPTAHTAVVTNYGAACWVRVQVQFSRDGELITEDTQGITANDMDEPSVIWKRAADGYYYLERILDEGESVEFSHMVTNPYGQTWDGSAFDFESLIVAEAIQASAFTPNFSVTSPWGDIEALTCAYAYEEGV